MEYYDLWRTGWVNLPDVEEEEEVYPEDLYDESNLEE